MLVTSGVQQLPNKAQLQTTCDWYIVAMETSVRVVGITITASYYNSALCSVENMTPG